MILAGELAKLSSLGQAEGCSVLLGLAVRFAMESLTGSIAERLVCSRERVSSMGRRSNMLTRLLFP